MTPRRAGPPPLWRRYLRFWGADVAADVDDEMAFHLEQRVAELVAAGMAPEAARAEAMRRIGDLEALKRACVSIGEAHEGARRRRAWLGALAADARLAARQLLRNPVVAVASVLTLALGIGANTAIFSVVRGVLLKPLPHRDGDRLVYLRQSMDGPGGANTTFSVPEVRDLRAGAPSLGGIAEYSPWFGTLQGEGDAVRIDVGLVTGNFFEVMGLSPALGRLTTPRDDGPGVPAVMVLTHDFWLKRFGGDSGIIGKQVRLDGTPLTVIGVVEPAPWFPDRMHALANMVVSPHHLSAQMVEGRSHRMTELVARLAPGATVEQARREVEGVYARMRREHAEAYAAASHYRVAVLPFREALGERARLTLWLLMGAAAFVLVISAANVANLTLMRGVQREPELVVRAALGAGTSRLRRLLLAENLVLTLAGALLGVVLAVGGVRLLVSLAERYSPRASEVRLDGAVLAFTLALALALALLLSLIPALPREGSFASRIAAGGRRVSGSLRKHRLQRGLVVAQVAVSVVLLAGAGLLTRTMIRLSRVDTGLRTEEVLTIEAPLLQVGGGPSAGTDPRAWFRTLLESDARVKVQYDRMRREIAALPGVTEVGVGSSMPLRGSGTRFEVKAEGRPLPVGEAALRPDFRTADPAYFGAAGIPLVKGRPFADTDVRGGARVVIVNETLAEKLFPGEDPIGKRVAWTGEVLKFSPISGDWRTIVGVAGNTQDGGQDAAPRAVMFMPFAQELAIGGVLVIRADSNVSGLAAAATRIVRRIAPDAPIENVLTVTQIKDESVAPRRLNAVLVSSFGLLALVIAAVGIAGVLAFSVSARTNEIGIRMSLGADGLRVQRMILGEGGVLVAVGLVLGVSGALLAARVIRGLLFGVQPHDPATFAAVAAMMAAIGVLACWIPARRAARVDPVVTMRST